LRYIVDVAREKHFGRAAQSCFVSQPTLSAAIKKLEDDLGMAIFERRPRDVALTPIGEQIVTRAHRVLEEVEGIRELASSGADPLTATLRIGAIYTIGPYLFPEMIPELNALSPKTPLVVEEGYTASLRKRLKQGELDAIIVAAPFEEPGVLTRPLYDEPFLVVLSTSHPLTQKSTVSVQDLARENVLLLGSGNCFRDQVLEVCPECVGTGEAEEGKTQLEGSSLETIRYMVASGMGVTIMPCTAVRADRFSERLLTVRRFKGISPGRQVLLAWRHSFTRPQAIDLLAQAIRQASMGCVNKIN